MYLVKVRSVLLISHTYYKFCKMIAFDSAEYSDTTLKEESPVENQALFVMSMCQGKQLLSRVATLNNTIWLKSSL